LAKHSVSPSGTVWYAVCTCTRRSRQTNVDELERTFIWKDLHGISRSHGGNLARTRAGVVHGETIDLYAIGRHKVGIVIFRDFACVTLVCMKSLTVPAYKKYSAKRSTYTAEWTISHEFLQSAEPIASW
jgi:hypothetical protein